MTMMASISVSPAADSSSRMSVVYPSSPENLMVEPKRNKKKKQKNYHNKGKKTFSCHTLFSTRKKTRKCAGSRVEQRRRKAESLMPTANNSALIWRMYNRT